MVLVLEFSNQWLEISSEAAEGLAGFDSCSSLGEICSKLLKNSRYPLEGIIPYNVADELCMPSYYRNWKAATSVSP